MSKFTYKTVDGSQTGFIPGVGEIIDGVITSDQPLENANLALVEDVTATETPLVGTASQQNPNQPQTADAPTNTGDTK